MTEKEKLILNLAYKFLLSILYALYAILGSINKNKDTQIFFDTSFAALKDAVNTKDLIDKL